MFHALVTSSMTSQGHKVGQILKLVYIRQYFSYRVDQKLKISEMLMTICLVYSTSGITPGNKSVAVFFFKYNVSPCVFVCISVCVCLCLSRCLSGRFSYVGLVPHKQYFAQNRVLPYRLPITREQELNIILWHLVMYHTSQYGFVIKNAWWSRTNYKKGVQRWWSRTKCKKGVQSAAVTFIWLPA